MIEIVVGKRDGGRPQGPLPRISTAPAPTRGIAPNEGERNVYEEDYKMMTEEQLDMRTGTIGARAPFDFGKTLGFLRGFGPTEGEQALASDAITKALTLHGRTVAFEVRGVGTVEEPRLAYTLYTERALDDVEESAVVDRLRFFLSLDDDLEGFYRMARADVAFAPVVERLYGLHQPKFLTPFEIACWAVLGQRIPWRVAHRMKMALVERWGTRITLAGGTYWAFPEAGQLAGVGAAELAEVVRNERKVEYLRAVIEFFNEVDERFLREGDYDEVMARIRGVRGIGEWSAHFMLVRGLGRMEVVSAIDKELLKAAERIYHEGRPFDAGELQALLDSYGTSQGYWALYARVALMGQGMGMGEM